MNKIAIEKIKDTRGMYRLENKKVHIPLDAHFGRRLFSLLFFGKNLSGSWAWDSNFIVVHVGKWHVESDVADFDVKLQIENWCIHKITSPFRYHFRWWQNKTNREKSKWLANLICRKVRPFPWWSKRQSYEQFQMLFHRNVIDDCKMSTRFASARARAPQNWTHSF